MSKLSVALVDDHVMLRNGLANLIDNFENFFVLLQANNGKEFIETILKTKSVPDLVLLDVNMPEMAGPPTAAYIKQNLPNTHILALSMSDEEDDIISMLRNGANGYILKNGDPEFLEKAMYDVAINNIYNTDTIIHKYQNSLKHPHESENIIKITAREKEFLCHCCSELTYKEIADRMNVSARTIDGYRENLFEKLNQKSRTGLAMFAIKHKIFSL